MVLFHLRTGRKLFSGQSEMYFGYVLFSDHLAVGIELIIRSRQEVVGLCDPVGAVNNQLTARTGVIVAAVKLEQTGVVAAAMPVAIQYAVFTYDTQRIGIRRRRRIRTRGRIRRRCVQHFAVRAELIVGGRQEVIGLCDPVGTVNNQLTA